MKRSTKRQIYSQFYCTNKKSLENIFLLSTFIINRNWNVGGSFKPPFPELNIKPSNQFSSSSNHSDCFNHQHKEIQNFVGQYQKCNYMECSVLLESLAPPVYQSHGVQVKLFELWFEQDWKFQKGSYYVLKRELESA